MPNNPNAYEQSAMTDWSFREHHVALDEGGTNTNPITSESVYIGAGPARFTQVGENLTDKVFPIGMIQNANVGQQQMVQQVREVGSRRSYIVSSYSTGNMTLSRVMYSHVSLLRALTVANDDGDRDTLDNKAGLPQGETFQGSDQSDVAEFTAQRQFHINMQAEIFDRPIGVLFYMLDQRNQPYGAMYAEDCMVQNHNFNLQARGVQMAEQVNMMFDRAKPVGIHNG